MVHAIQGVASQKAQRVIDSGNLHVAQE